MARADKDPFEGLPEEFRTMIDGMSRDEIKVQIAKVALDNVELMKAKKEDQDLTEKREQHREAGAIYRDGSKANRQKIEYCKVVIDQKGGR